MSIWLDLLCLGLLILLNGFFAMSEIAIVTARRAKLQVLADNGSERAKLAISLAENPTRALSTIQVGITSIGILSGIVGENALVAPVASFLAETFKLSQGTATAISLAAVVMGITYCSIVIGELVPKRIGQLGAEAIARFVAAPIHWLSIIAMPFVKLLSVSTELLLRVLGIKDQGQQITEEEIHSMIEEGSESGVIDAQEHTMVKNVFRLDDRAIASLMIPRSEVEYIDLEDKPEENLQKLLNSKHTALPLCEGGLDDIKGVITTRLVLQQVVNGGKPDFKNMAISPVYVPESLTGMELLENFRKEDVHIALVVDEYGEVLGLVTPHDVLEAIVGEFKPDTPADAMVVKINDNEYDIGGLLPIPEMKDVLDIDECPDEDRERYTTVAGMVMYVLERIPKEGDEISLDGWRLTITKMDGRRVDRLLIKKMDVESVTPKDA